jgi:hypothetical protein
VQLGDFLRSNNAKWALAYYKLLPQSKEEWQALTKVASPAKRRKQSQGQMVVGDGSPTLTIQQAALHHLLDQLPGLESLLMEHVNATVSGGLGRQLDALPPSVHAAACNHHVEVVQSGRQQLRLDILNAGTWHAAAAVLPQMQGLDSLKLTVQIDSRNDFLISSFLNRMTALKELELNLKYSSLILRHLSGLATLQHLNLSGCSSVTDSSIAQLSSLTALQHLDLSWTQSVTDSGIALLSSLTALQHLNLSWCNCVTDSGIAQLSSLTALQHLDLSCCHCVTDSGIAHLSSLPALHHLDLGCCESVTGSGISLLSGLTTLQHLDLSGCSSVTDSGIALLSGLTALQHLNLWGHGSVRQPKNI